MTSSNQKLNLRTSLQGTTPFLEIQSVNTDHFEFTGSSQLGLKQNLTVENMTVNGTLTTQSGQSLSAGELTATTSLTTPKIIATDNNENGLVLESSDGADFIVLDTRDGVEKIDIKKDVNTAGNKITMGTNGSRGIIQYGNIKNSTIDNTNTLSANTSGTSSAWSSTMRLDLSNPYTSQLISFINFDGSSDKELPLYYIDESSSASHRFLLQNTEAGHDSANLQTKIEFRNQYHPSLTRVDKRMAELISTTDNFSTLIYDSQSSSNYSEFSLGYDKNGDIPSIGNFVFFDTRSNGERIMRLENRFLQYDTTTQEKQYATSIHLCNAGDFRDTVVEDEIAKIQANWRADGQGQLKLLARRTANSSAQECGLLITDSAGGNVIQGYQQDNNMVIAGQQIDGFCDIKYFNGCAIGNSSHLGQGLEYKDSGGSVISGASVGYDNTLELKLADDTLQTSGSGLSVKLKGSGGLQEATGNAGLEVKLKTGGGLDVDGNGLFISNADTDKIEDADGDTFIKVEATTDNDTIDFNTAGSNAMKIKSNGQVVIGSNISGTNTNNAVMTITDTRSGYVGIQHYYLQLGGDEYLQNSHVSLGFGYVASNSDTNVPPANIRFIETDSTGASGGYLALGCRESTGSGSYEDMTMTIKQGRVGIGGSDVPIINPQARLEIKSNSTDNLLRITGDDDANAPFFDITSGTSFVSLRTGDGTECLNMRHSSQFVGIGTNAPDTRLHVVGATYQSGGSWRYFSDNAGDIGLTTYEGSSYVYATIKTNGSMWINGSGLYSYFLTSSDRRIKKDIEIINDDEALNIINNLETVKYYYTDPAKHKEVKTIGFIAQDLIEAGLENAVSIQKEFLPDILQKIDCVWEGNKLIYDIDISGEEYTGRVLFKYQDGDEVKDIIVDSDLVFKKQYSQLYCYGREVNDFHTIDKQQIFALHHSGIQELSRKNDLLENKCNLLETENNNLLERTQLLEDTVSSLETLINDLTKRVKVNETTLHGMIN